MTPNISAPMSDGTTYLEYWDCVRLENAANTLRNKLIIALMFRSGLRVSEVVQLKKEDVIFPVGFRKIGHGPVFSEEAYLSVYEKGSKKKGKPKKEMAMLDLELQPILHEYIKDIYSPEFIFKSPWKETKNIHLTIRAVYNILKKTGERSGITKDIGGKNIHPHTLRHSLAIFLVKQGVKLSKIQAILRHKSLSSTSYYLKFSREEVLKDYHAAFRRMRE